MSSPAHPRDRREAGESTGWSAVRPLARCLPERLNGVPWVYRNALTAFLDACRACGGDDCKRDTVALATAGAEIPKPESRIPKKIPEPKAQKPKAQRDPKSQGTQIPTRSVDRVGIWDLGFGISLGFGIWAL